MKHLIFINGTMGVGKTTTARQLLHLLPGAAFLDGDWCWTFYPDKVCDEPRAMAVDNIVHILRGYLTSQSYNTVVFCWVVPSPQVMEAILAPLAGLAFCCHAFTLTCTPQALRAHFEKDDAAGLRRLDSWQESAQRLPLYGPAMPTHKIDVTNRTPAQVAAALLAHCHLPG